NKNCVGAPGTGSISLNIDGTPTPASGVTYDWSEGKLLTRTALASAHVPAPGHTAVVIGDGFYTVRATNEANNCSAVSTLHINADPAVFSIPAASISVVDQTDCSPENGSAEVIDVFVDGVSSGGTAGYTFEWFLNDGVTPIPSSSATAAVGTALGANSYYVAATNTTSNCV